MSKYLDISISITTDSLPTSYRQITDSRPSVDRQIAKTIEKTVFTITGFATKHFNLSRGVRQGCPLCGILFVIGVEILSNAIKRSKEIERIQIVPNTSIKITQYADDTTIFVKDIRSVHRLFDLLQQFENCSGLRINQSKSEILWLGSLRQRK